jgi:hypothetical protein
VIARFGSSSRQAPMKSTVLRILLPDGYGANCGAT